MGEFTNDTLRPETLAAKDRDFNANNGEVETDVDGVIANGEKDGLPIFDVDKNEFYQNMNYGRKRLRFKNGSNVQNYMNQTKYKRPFWIRHGEGKNTFIRKIK
jgi:hypothetical protein